MCVMVAGINVFLQLHVMIKTMVNLTTTTTGYSEFKRQKERTRGGIHHPLFFIKVIR